MNWVRAINILCGRNSFERWKIFGIFFTFACFWIDNFFWRILSWVRNKRCKYIYTYILPTTFLPKWKFAKSDLGNFTQIDCRRIWKFEEICWNKWTGTSTRNHQKNVISATTWLGHCRRWYLVGFSTRCSSNRDTGKKNAETHTTRIFAEVLMVFHVLKTRKIKIYHEYDHNWSLFLCTLHNI